MVGQVGDGGLVTYRATEPTSPRGRQTIAFTLTNLLPVPASVGARVKLTSSDGEIQSRSIGFSHIDAGGTVADASARLVPFGDNVCIVKVEVVEVQATPLPAVIEPPVVAVAKPPKPPAETPPPPEPAPRPEPVVDLSPPAPPPAPALPPPPEQVVAAPPPPVAAVNHPTAEPAPGTIVINGVTFIRGREPKSLGTISQAPDPPGQ